MKKFLLSAAVPVVAGVFLGAPYYLGVKAEESLEEQHAVLADTFFFDVVSHDYDRGWFSSTETTVLRFHPSVLANLQDQLPDNLKEVLDRPIVMVNHVKHGLFAEGLVPVRAAVDTELQFDPAVQKTLSRFFGEQIPVSVHNVIYLNGSGRMAVKVAPFEYEELSGIKLDWKGMDAQVDYQPRFTEYNTHFKIPGLKAVLADKGSLKIENVDLNSLSRTGKSGLMLGSSDTQVGTFEIEWKDKLDYNVRLDKLINMVSDLQIGAFINPTGSIAPSHISLKNLKYQTSTDEKDGFADSRGKFSFTSFDYGEDKYGPLEVDIAAEHLQSQSLVALKRRWEQIATEKHEAEKMREQFVAALRKEGAGIFTNNPVLKINRFSFQTPSGHIKADGQLSFNGLRTEDLDVFADIAAKTKAKLNLDVSQKLLERMVISQADSLFSVDDPDDVQAKQEIGETIRLLVAGTLDSMSSQGYLSRNNGAVQTTVQIGNNQILLNGKRFSTEEEEIVFDDMESAEGQVDAADSATASQP